jgi:hypothetical protein
MVNPKNVLWARLIVFMIIVVMLASCNRKTSQDQLLHDLNADTIEQFSSLSTCKQVEVYTIVGSEYLDIDHMVALVPTWMNDVLSRQSPQVIVGCIAEQGQKLLSEWNDDPSQYEKNSFKMHALIYKAIELHLLDKPEIENLVQTLICETSILDKGRLDIFFYTRKHPGLANYPSVDKMEIDLCR